MAINSLLLQILKHQNYRAISIGDIVDLSNSPAQEVSKALEDMERSGQVLGVEGKFKLFPDECQIGQIMTNSRGDAYITQRSGEKVFLNDDLCGIKEYDTVVVDLANPRRAKLVKILDRDCERALFEVIDDGEYRRYKGINNNNNITLSLDESADKLVDGQLFLANVGLEHEDGVYKGQLYSIVGHRNDPDIRIKEIALSHNIDINFSEEAIDELKDIPSNIEGEDLSRRRDLRDKKIFTIDGDDTKDIDDALSIEILDNGNYKLGVHIADVSHYLKRDSALFKDASQRGTSVYLADSVIPMIPHELSSGICSLKPGDDRLCLSCEMEINPRGHVVNYDIFKSVIQSKKKMTYNEVNQIIAGEDIESYDDYLDELLIADELAEILKRNNHDNGKLDFEVGEASLGFNENGLVSRISKKDKAEAECMIEAFMTLTNEVIAEEFGVREGIPFVYRTHDVPDEQDIEKVIWKIERHGHQLRSLNIDNFDIYDANTLYQTLIEECSLYKDFPVSSTHILSSLPKAKYSVKNSGHFGIAAENYTHFTAPIRRLPDLVVHHLISDYLDGKITRRNYEEIRAKLSDICYHASKKEREAGRAEIDVFKLKCIEYIKEHPDEEYTAYVATIDEGGIEVKTDNLISGVIDINSLPEDSHCNSYSLSSRSAKLEIGLGDELLVKVDNYSESDLSIEFKLVKPLDKVRQFKKEAR